jgi:hypothetical protein
MEIKEKIILDLCGGTGSWAKPYKDAGYDVRTITLPDYDVENWRHTGLEALVKSNKVYGILAAPPCTMFSIARNDKTAKAKRDLRKGMKTVQACLDIIHECLYDPFLISKNNLKFWALENPASGYLDRFLGTPPFVFDPSDYGDNHSKKTALWGMFNEPKKGKKVIVKKGDADNYVKNVEKYFKDKAHLIPDGYRKKTGLSMRTVVRSITPQGFAKAFYEANK